MRSLIVPVLTTCICVGVVVASPPRPTDDPTAVQALKQLEQDMGVAMVRVDIDRLKQIYADDFVTIGSSGKIVNKKDLLSDFGSFHERLVSFENGPMDVQVFGNVAVVHGSSTVKRIRDGRDASGEFVWMDLLEKRAGKWVVVRSAGTRVTWPIWPLAAAGGAATPPYL